MNTTTHDEMKGEHLTTRQFADRFCVHEESVRRWLRAKRLVGIKLGLDWRIPASEVARIEHEGVPPQT